MTYLVLSMLLVPVFAVLSALDSPGGVLVLLVPRYRRHVYRMRRPRAEQRSARISKRLRTMVMRADRGRCVFCFSRVAVQVDHIVPWSMGGLTCLWNCAVLCGAHNKVKSNYWRSDSGKVYYRGFRGSTSRNQAAAILSVELEARRRPLRWLRAYGLLPSW